MNKIINILQKYKYPTAHYGKSAYIHYEGETCSLVEIVLKGHIRILSIDSNGNEIVYKDLGPGDVYGNNLIFSSSHLYRGNVTAQEDSIVVAMEKEEYLSLLSKDRDFLEAMLTYQSEDSKRLNQTLKLLTASTSEEKLLYLLKTSGNEIKVKSVTDLAKRLNMTREATSRLIHRLVREKKISFADKIIKRT